jgi:hypothetical protein
LQVNPEARIYSEKQLDKTKLSAERLLAILNA